MNKQSLEKLYIEGGSSLIAERLGCCLPTVYKLLKEAGITLDGRKRKSGRKKKFQLDKL